MRHLYALWVIGVCVVIVGCGSNVGTLQNNPVVDHSGPQVDSERRASSVTNNANREDSHATFAAVAYISDQSTGRISKIAFGESNPEESITMHNGSDMLVQVVVEHQVTGIIVDGDALHQAALQQSSDGHWQGKFQYWDGSNTRNSKTTVTLLFILQKSSIRKALLVRTIHDS